MARARQSIRPLVVDDTFVEQDLSDLHIALMACLLPDKSKRKTPRTIKPVV